MSTKWIVTGLTVILFISAAVYVLAYVAPALFADFKFSSPIASPVSKPNSLQPVITNSPPTAGLPVNTALKTYQGAGFSLQYPKEWGLMTCSNSYNFELDPINITDQISVPCDYASKPISVLLTSDLMGCEGTTIKLGNWDVLKSESTTENYTTITWCTLTQPALIFTNRVSTTTTYAASPNDYSNQVEIIIKSLTF